MKKLSLIQAEEIKIKTKISKHLIVITSGINISNRFNKKQKMRISSKSLLGKNLSKIDLTITSFNRMAKIIKFKKIRNNFRNNSLSNINNNKTSNKINK